MYSNVFNFELPLSKVNLTFKILSHRDETDISNMVKRKKKQARSTQVSYELTSRLKAMITAVDGDEDQNTINKFVDEQFISETGEVLLSNLDSVGVAGNNSYYSLQLLSSLDYVSSDNNEMVSKLLELDKS